MLPLSRKGTCSIEMGFGPVNSIGRIVWGTTVSAGTAVGMPLRLRNASPPTSFTLLNACTTFELSGCPQMPVTPPNQLGGIGRTEVFPILNMAALKERPMVWGSVAVVSPLANSSINLAPSATARKGENRSCVAIISGITVVGLRVRRSDVVGRIPSDRRVAAACLASSASVLVGGEADLEGSGVEKAFHGSMGCGVGTEGRNSSHGFAITAPFFIFV